MATLKNRRKLAAVNREIQSRKIILGLPCYGTQMIHLLILGALSKWNEFLLNLQVPAQSGTVPGTSWNSSTENQEPKLDRSQNDPRPELGTSIYRSPRKMNSDPNKKSYSLHFFVMIMIWPQLISSQIVAQGNYCKPGWQIIITGSLRCNFKERLSYWDTLYPTWEDPRQERGLERAPKKEIKRYAKTRALLMQIRWI